MVDRREGLYYAAFELIERQARELERHLHLRFLMRNEHKPGSGKLPGEFALECRGAAINDVLYWAENARVAGRM